MVETPGVEVLPRLEEGGVPGRIIGGVLLPACGTAVASSSPNPGSGGGPRGAVVPPRPEDVRAQVADVAHEDQDCVAQVGRGGGEDGNCGDGVVGTAFAAAGLPGRPVRQAQRLHPPPHVGVRVTPGILSRGDRRGQGRREGHAEGRRRHRRHGGVGGGRSRGGGGGGTAASGAGAAAASGAATLLAGMVPGPGADDGGGWDGQRHGLPRALPPLEPPHDGRIYFFRLRGLLVVCVEGY